MDCVLANVAEGEPLRSGLICLALWTGRKESDYKGAALMLDALPPAKTLLGDRGYDAGWFGNALAERGIVPCIPSKPTAKYRSLTTRRSTGNATRSRTCLAASRTGGASIADTIAAPTPFLSHLYRSNRHLLDQTMSPEPRRRSKSTCSHFASRMAPVRAAVMMPSITNSFTCGSIQASISCGASTGYSRLGRSRLMGGFAPIPCEVYANYIDEAISAVRRFARPSCYRRGIVDSRRLV